MCGKPAGESCTGKWELVNCLDSIEPQTMSQHTATTGNCMASHATSWGISMSRWHNA